MAGYISHTKEKFQYMSNVLMQIDKNQEFFRDIHCSNAQIYDNETGPCNFAKWHAIIHYLNDMRFYDSAVEYIIGIGKTWHIT